MYQEQAGTETDAVKTWQSFTKETPHLLMSLTAKDLQPSIKNYSLFMIMSVSVLLIPKKKKKLGAHTVYSIL